MKLAIIYDSKDNRKEKFSIDLKNNINKLNNDNIVIDIYESQSNIRDLYDVYILVIYNIDQLIKCQEKIREYSKVLVLTDNTDAKFIISCVNYTKNLCYLNIEINTILNKIFSIYQNSKKNNQVIFVETVDKKTKKYLNCL